MKPLTTFYRIAWTHRHLEIGGRMPEKYISPGEASLRCLQLNREEPEREYDIIAVKRGGPILPMLGGLVSRIMVRIGSILFFGFLFGQLSLFFFVYSSPEHLAVVAAASNMQEINCWPFEVVSAMLLFVVFSIAGGMLGAMLEELFMEIIYRFSLALQRRLNKGV